MTTVVATPRRMMTDAAFTTRPTLSSEAAMLLSAASILPSSSPRWRSTWLVARISRALSNISWMASDTTKASARALAMLLVLYLRRPKSRPNATGTPHMTAIPNLQSKAMRATATTAVEMYDPYR